MTNPRSIRAAIVAALLTSLALAVTAPATLAQAAGTRIELGNTPAGQVLTNRAGYVLLMFPREENSLKVCMRIRACMADWPPVLTAGAPVAGRGVDANLLGTEPYKGRRLEVTYAGWPLHSYKFAYSAQNSVLDIGIRQFGDQWDALNPAGQLVS